MKMLKKIWLTNTLIALLLAAGAAMAETADEIPAWAEAETSAPESYAAFRETEGFAERRAILKKWEDDIQSALQKSMGTADEVFATAQQDVQDMRAGTLESSEVERRRQQVHAPALRAGIKELNQVFTQTHVVFDALANDLQTAFDQKQCADNLLNKDCAGLKFGIYYLPQLYAKFERMMQILAQVMELRFESVYLQPNAPADLERLLEIMQEMETLSDELNELRASLGK